MFLRGYSHGTPTVVFLQQLEVGSHTPQLPRTPRGDMRPDVEQGAEEGKRRPWRAAVPLEGKSISPRLARGHIMSGVL